MQKLGGESIISLLVSLNPLVMLALLIKVTLNRDFESGMSTSCAEFAVAVTDPGTSLKMQRRISFFYMLL